MQTSKPEPKREDPQRPEGNTVPQETEEEYDARLEREEQERMEKAKRLELEHIQRIHENTNSTQGIRFKGMLLKYPCDMQYSMVVGRGRMKFVDPELHHRQ